MTPNIQVFQRKYPAPKIIPTKLLKCVLSLHFFQPIRFLTLGKSLILLTPKASVSSPSLLRELPQELFQYWMLPVLGYGQHKQKRKTESG